MQYKIPVQVENEDKIFLNLSIRQIVIIMLGGAIAYSIFNGLEKDYGGAVALFPAGIVVFITLVIALFKTSEMTFFPFMLNLLRLNLNSSIRVWSKGVDSFDKITIGYVAPPFNSTQDQLNTKIIKNVHEDILSKI
ncbi:MAG: PrgI family protein [Candidatus Gracilibacteria bacterium]|nr:PrgI family protein [Candidatus Gracilibacteria bacterium]MDD2908585.1 PrgI family protein [Candidatus Gracilibacteria bacterium]